VPSDITKTRSQAVIKTGTIISFLERDPSAFLTKVHAAAASAADGRALACPRPRR
jgi:hypothetical protein